MIEYLRRKDYGRATLLPISLLHRNPANEAELRQLRMEHCFGLASELVECNDEMRPVVEYLLGRTAVVQDLAAGIALKKKTGGAFHIATLEGDIISTGGAMSGGSRQKRGFSLLGREREMEELQQALQQKEARLETLQGACEELRKALLLADLQADAFRAELHEKDLAMTRQSEKVDIIDRDRARAEEQAGRLEEERQQLDENLADIRCQREESVALQRDIELGNATSREDVQRTQAALAGKRAAREAASKQLTEQKVRLMALQKERDAVQAEHNRLAAERDAVKNALLAQETAIRETAAQIAAAERRLVEMQQSVQAEQAQAGAQKEQHRRLEEERAARADSLAQLRKRREEALQSTREIGERKHRQELQKSRAEMELAGMQDRIWEEYELTYENALPYRHDIPIAASGTRVNEIKAEIRDMGDINLSAIEDYRAVSERHAALAGPERGPAAGKGRSGNADRGAYRHDAGRILPATARHPAELYPRVCGVVWRRACRVAPVRRKGRARVRYRYHCAAARQETAAALAAVRRGTRADRHCAAVCHATAQTAGVLRAGRD